MRTILAVSSASFALGVLLLAAPTAVPANDPKVISVSPPDGATNVDLKQELRVRFDQPMNPDIIDLMWQKGGFLPGGQPRYEQDRDEFVVPVRLMAGQTNEVLAYSEAHGGGFRTTNMTFASDYRWHFTTKPAVATPGGIKPHVTRITPKAGQTLPVLTLFQIAFDRPMTPPDQRLPYLRKMGWSMDVPQLIFPIDYDPPNHRFTVPVVLPPDNDTKLTLEGFFSAEGVESDPVVIHCEIGTNSYSTEQQDLISTAARDPRLEQLLSSMKAARARLHSGVETVERKSFSFRNGSCNGLSTDSATFQWQGTNQVTADASEIMNVRAFILGNDGKTCWLYADTHTGRRVDSSPAALVPDIYTSVADPFTLTKKTVAEAIASGALLYRGQAQLEGQTCHRVQSWVVRQPRNEHDRLYAAGMEWWIDADTFLPAQVINNGTWGSQTFRFHYTKLNQPLPDTDFQPPSMGETNAQKDAFRLFEHQTPDPDERRFLTIRDGCNGTMSARLGRNGPTGSVNSGLN
jgi:hypothetical protein